MTTAGFDNCYMGDTGEDWDLSVQNRDSAAVKMKY